MKAQRGIMSAYEDFLATQRQKGLYSRSAAIVSAELSSQF
jgi:hypothetical protein